MVRRGWRGAVAVAALACLVLAGCSDDAPASAGDGLTATAETGIVRGVVVDQGIRPLAGANVTLATEPPRSMVTGDDGSFGFGEVPPGTYRLDARKAGFTPASTTVDVQAGVDDPRAANLMLAFDAGLVPFSQALVFEGFVECSFHLHGGYFAACAAGPIANNLLCSSYDVCLGNVTNDRVFAFQTVDGLPAFLQSELVWETTQQAGHSLMLYENYGTLDQFNGGGFEGTFNITMGPSPLLLTVNETEMADAELGTTYHLVPEVLAGAYEPTEACIPSASGPPDCGGFGVAVEQRFALFTHLFYNHLPPAGWRFSADGGPPPPPS